MSIITLDNVRVVHGRTLALAIDHLTVEQGELLAVLGPSGSGKTTLLRAIAGLDPLTSGSIRFDGVDFSETPTAERGVAMVFQENALFPHRDARGNVSFPLEVQHTERSEIKRRVDAEARVLEIEHLLDRMPRQLGAGHQQLVQAARALVRVPEAFLMDEPMARLDARLRVQMRHEFRLLQQGYGVTTVLVTNDQVEAMAMADRIVVLREGRPVQVGEPLELYHRPGNRFVGEFLGSPPMRIFPARLTSDTPGYWLEFGEFHIRAWAPSLAAAADGQVDVGVRPEDIVIDPNGVEVAVRRSYFDGTHGYAEFEVAPGYPIEMRTSEPLAAPSKALRIRLRRLHVFHPATGAALGRVDDGAG